jgi:hypothetical protein
VLGTEHGDDVHVIAGGHHVDLVTQVRQDTCGIGDDAHLLTTEKPIAVPCELLDADPHSARASARTGRLSRGRGQHGLSGSKAYEAGKTGEDSSTSHRRPSQAPGLTPHTRRTITHASHRRPVSTTIAPVDRDA